MKLEQNLIDAYSGEGWKGQSREKIRPEKELQRARKQILKCRLGIRDAIRQLDSLSSLSSIEDSAIALDGSVYHEHIFCVKCNMREELPDNDIILCDGTCKRAFHQKCLDPPLDTENIPPGERSWFCKFCECKMEILEAMNAHLGTHFSLHSTWGFKPNNLLHHIFSVFIPLYISSILNFIKYKRMYIKTCIYENVLNFLINCYLLDFVLFALKNPNPYSPTGSTNNSFLP
ncbi:Pathogenesis-related homeodomain protein [Spatholobus suberectus]|nr:Pathogenesis-related homeodomain protein [Spatholobus suberectus]